MEASYLSPERRKKKKTLSAENCLSAVCLELSLMTVLRAIRAGYYPLALALPLRVLFTRSSAPSLSHDSQLVGP